MLFTSWEANEDSTEWDIKIREGVKFSNGEELTAEDVKLSWDVWFTDETLAAQNVNWKTLTEVEIVNDYEVIFHFSEPMASFPYMTSRYQIVEKDAYEKVTREEHFKNPVTCGAWLFESWEPGADLVMRRNDNWWGASEGELSNVDKFIFRFVSEDTTRVVALSTGEIDFIRDIPAEQVDAVSALEGVTYYSEPSSTLAWSGFECGKGYIFNDKNARLAAVYAIDRQLICDTLLGGGDAWYWLCPESSTGWSAEGFENGKKYAYDLDKAKEYLPKSDYDGTPIRIICASGKLPRNDEVIQAFALMLEEAGFAVDLQVMDNAAWVDKRSSGDYDMFISSVAFAQNTVMWSNKHIVADTGHYEFSNPTLIDTVTKACSATQYDEQVKLLEDAYAIVVEEAAPIVSWFALESRYACSSTISNFISYPDQTFNFNRIQKAN